MKSVSFATTTGGDSVECTSQLAVITPDMTFQGG